MSDSIAALQSSIRQFAEAREWQPFHTPKNLVMALTSEVGELSELYQWLAHSELPDRQSVAMELADIFIYLIRLADVAGIDLLNAARAKMIINASRYTIEKSKGNAIKQ